MRAPHWFRYWARSTISGSRAAFAMTVVPCPVAAARSRFSVAPTLGKASEMKPPRIPFGARHRRQPCSSRISTPSFSSAERCRSIGRGPISHPPGNERLASPARARIAPRNTIDERISRIRLCGISHRDMPSARMRSVLPRRTQRQPSRRRMRTETPTSESSGQLCSTVSPRHTTAAARSGSVLFFAPCTRSSPLNGRPPRVRIVSGRSQKRSAPDRSIQILMDAIRTPRSI